MVRDRIDATLNNQQNLASVINEKMATAEIRDKIVKMQKEIDELRGTGRSKRPLITLETVEEKRSKR